MDSLTRYLDDPKRVRIWVPEQDDPRWDDPEDHGDPKIERWARGLGQLGSDIAMAAMIACVDAIAIVWKIDVGTTTIEDALVAARSRSLAPINAALARLASDESLARWAHTHDVWAAARDTLRAARDPMSAELQLEFVALFAFRVIGWSRDHMTDGQGALSERLATFAVEGTDDADRSRQTLRCIVRAALIE